MGTALNRVDVRATSCWFLRCSLLSHGVNSIFGMGLRRGSSSEASEIVVAPGEEITLASDQIIGGRSDRLLRKQRRRTLCEHNVRFRERLESNVRKVR